MTLLKMDLRPVGADGNSVDVARFFSVNVSPDR